MPANLKDPADVARLTAWGEARDQGVAGMQAVLNTLANRAAKPCWWGDTIISCALHPWQYSCWDYSDLNREKLLAAGDADLDPADAVALAEASALAALLVRGALADLTGGADSYYREGSPVPLWAKSAEMTCAIGAHIYFITRPERVVA